MLRKPQSRTQSPQAKPLTKEPEDSGYEIAETWISSGTTGPLVSKDLSLNINIQIIYYDSKSFNKMAVRFCDFTRAWE